MRFNPLNITQRSYGFGSGPPHLSTVIVYFFSDLFTPFSWPFSHLVPHLLSHLHPIVIHPSTYLIDSFLKTNKNNNKIVGVIIETDKKIMWTLLIMFILFFLILLILPWRLITTVIEIRLWESKQEQNKVMWTTWIIFILFFLNCIDSSLMTNENSN